MGSFFFYGKFAGQFHLNNSFHVGKTRLLLIVFEVLLLVLLAASVVDSFSDEKSPANPENLVSKILGDTSPSRRRARSQSLSLDDNELRAGAAAYRQVLSRNPLDAAAWEGLAAIESKLGDENAQSAVLRGWILSIPHSPKASWALANLLVRQGKMQESFPYFRRAAADEPSLREPLFELSQKLVDDPRQILSDLIPEDAAVRQQYFYFLTDRKIMLAEAEPVWREVFKAKGEMAIPIGARYVERLAAAGLGTEAARVWNEMFPESNATESDRHGEQIHNGDFERSLRNGGLEWQFTPDTGYKFSLDDFQARGGSRSLRLSFDGTTNPEFSAVRQWVIVNPNTDYDFSAAIKTENLTTNNGIYFSLSEVGNAAGSIHQTEPQSGSIPWTQERMKIHTGPQTRVLLFMIRRQASTKLDNLLRGDVWIDSISLRPSK